MSGTNCRLESANCDREAHICHCRHFPVFLSCFYGFTWYHKIYHYTTLCIVPMSKSEILQAPRAVTYNYVDLTSLCGVCSFQESGVRVLAHLRKNCQAVVGEKAMPALVTLERTALTMRVLSSRGKRWVMCPLQTALWRRPRNETWSISTLVTSSSICWFCTGTTHKESTLKPLLLKGSSIQSSPLFGNITHWGRTQCPI